MELYLDMAFLAKKNEEGEKGSIVLHFFDILNRGVYFFLFWNNYSNNKNNHISLREYNLILLMFASIAKGICINDTELPMCSALASKRRQQVY